MTVALSCFLLFIYLFLLLPLHHIPSFLSPLEQVPEVISRIRQVSKSAFKEDAKSKQDADEAFYNSQKFEVLYCGKVDTVAHQSSLFLLFNLPRFNGFNSVLISVTDPR